MIFCNITPASHIIHDPSFSLGVGAVCEPDEAELNVTSINVYISSGKKSLSDPSMLPFKSKDP